MLFLIEVFVGSLFFTYRSFLGSFEVFVFLNNVGFVKGCCHSYHSEFEI